MLRYQIEAGALNPASIWAMSRASVAGLPQVRLHDLRHSFASYMLKAGVDVKTIGATLGHSSVRVILDTYAHVLDVMPEAAVQKFETFLADKGQKRNVGNGG